MTYEKARADFEYLETIRELDDQVELDSQREWLMRNPTKESAKSMYESAIQLWFTELKLRPIADLPPRVNKIKNNG